MPSLPPGLDHEVPMGYLPGAGFHVNLAGDYRYLRAGYYASQDLETAGVPVHPTCKEILDAYVVPLCLEKANKAGLRVPEFYVTSDYFEPPVIIDTVNPFMVRQSVVLKEGHQDRVSRSLTRNYTYAICCQEIPPGARITRVRCILGWCAYLRFRPLTTAVWEVFNMPLATIRVLVPDDGDLLLSGLQPLPFGQLTQREKAYLEQVVQWPT